MSKGYRNCHYNKSSYSCNPNNKGYKLNSKIHKSKYQKISRPQPSSQNNLSVQVQPIHSPELVDDIHLMPIPPTPYTIQPIYSGIIPSLIHVQPLTFMNTFERMILIFGSTLEYNKATRISNTRLNFFDFDNSLTPPSCS